MGFFVYCIMNKIIRDDDGGEFSLPDRFGNCIRCGKSDTKEPLPSDVDDFVMEIIDKYHIEEEGVDSEEVYKSTYYLCEDCLPIWEKYGSNVEYPEKYCFVCGEEHKTSVKRPFCKDCTYERKWNDDDYKKEVQKNTEKWLSDNNIDD